MLVLCVVVSYPFLPPPRDPQLTCGLWGVSWQSSSLDKFCSLEAMVLAYAHTQADPATHGCTHTPCGRHTPLSQYTHCVCVLYTPCSNEVCSFSAVSVVQVWHIQQSSSKSTKSLYSRSTHEYITIGTTHYYIHTRPISRAPGVPRSSFTRYDENPWNIAGTSPYVCT